MPQSWEQFVASQEDAAWGEVLESLIDGLAALMDSDLAPLANPLRRQLEERYEKAGGRIDFKGSLEQLTDHLLYVHGWENRNFVKYQALETVHNAFHATVEM